MPKHITQSPALREAACAEMENDLLEAISTEAASLKDEARVLLERRRELLTWRRSLLDSR